MSDISPFLGAFHSFDSAIVEKTTKRPEGGEGGKEGEREGQAIAVLVIRSAGARREKGLGKDEVPLCKTAQGSLKPLFSTHTHTHRERERERETER